MTDRSELLLAPKHESTTTRAYRMLGDAELRRTPLFIIETRSLNETGYQRLPLRVLGERQGEGLIKSGVRGLAGMGKDLTYGLAGMGKDLAYGTARTGTDLGKRAVIGTAKAGMDLGKGALRHTGKGLWNAGKWALGHAASGAANLGRGLVGAEKGKETGMHAIGSKAREGLKNWRAQRATANQGGEGGDQQTPAQPGQGQGLVRRLRSRFGGQGNQGAQQEINSPEEFNRLPQERQDEIATAIGDAQRQAERESEQMGITDPNDEAHQARVQNRVQRNLGALGIKAGKGAMDHLNKAAEVARVKSSAARSKERQPTSQEREQQRQAATAQRLQDIKTGSAVDRMKGAVPKGSTTVEKGRQLSDAEKEAFKKGAAAHAERSKQQGKAADWLAQQGADPAQAERLKGAASKIKGGQFDAAERAAKAAKAAPGDAAAAAAQQAAADAERNKKFDAAKAELGGYRKQQALRTQKGAKKEIRKQAIEKEKRRRATDAAAERLKARGAYVGGDEGPAPQAPPKTLAKPSDLLIKPEPKPQAPAPKLQIPGQPDPDAKPGKLILPPGAKMAPKKGSELAKAVDQSGGKPSIKGPATGPGGGSGGGGGGSRGPVAGGGQPGPGGIEDGRGTAQEPGPEGCPPGTRPGANPGACYPRSKNDDLERDPLRLVNEQRFRLLRV